MLGNEVVFQALAVAVHSLDVELTAALEVIAAVSHGPSASRTRHRRPNRRVDGRPRGDGQPSLPSRQSRVGNVTQGEMLHCTMHACSFRHIEPLSRSSWR